VHIHVFIGYLSERPRLRAELCTVHGMPIEPSDPSLSASTLFQWKRHTMPNTPVIHSPKHLSAVLELVPLLTCHSGFTLHATGGSDLDQMSQVPLGVCDCWRNHCSWPTDCESPALADRRFHKEVGCRSTHASVVGCHGRKRRRKSEEYWTFHRPGL
jgi:hypothetical protein